jgi:hypothetical protein
MDRLVDAVVWAEYEADPDLRTTSVPFNDNKDILTWRRMTRRLASADAWESGSQDRPLLQNASSQCWGPDAEHLSARLRKDSVGCCSFGCEKVRWNSRCPRQKSLAANAGARGYPRPEVATEFNLRRSSSPCNDAATTRNLHFHDLRNPAIVSSRSTAS